MMFDRRDALKLSAGAATSVALGGRSLIAIAQDDLNLRLQLGWIANVEYAGVWLALERGYFRQRGIDLQYAAGGPNSPPPPVVVASGNADIGYTTWLPFLDAVARGNEFVMIGATFPVSPLGIISLAKRPIRVPADLVDAKILAQGPNEKTAIDATLTLAGLPVRWTMVPAGFSPEPLLAGDAPGLHGVWHQPGHHAGTHGARLRQRLFLHEFRRPRVPQLCQCLVHIARISRKEPATGVRIPRGRDPRLARQRKGPECRAQASARRFGKDFGLDLAQQTRQNQLQIPLVRAAAPRPILTLDREVIAGPMMAAARATGRNNLPDIAAIIDFKVAEEANASL